MPSGRQPIPQAEIGNCIRWWQRVLNIEHWRVDHKLVPKEKMTSPANMMEFRPTRARMHALIVIRQDIVERLDTIEFQKLIVHELAHLIYDPIAEEHGFQCQFSMDGVRAEENRYRFTQALEKAVEHTAQMLFKALPIQTESWSEPLDPLEGDNW